MLDDSCIFCKIIQKKIPSKIVKENEYVLVIEDIAPKAPIHYLVIAKKHIININYLTDADSQIVWEMIKMIRDVAKDVQKTLKLKEPLNFNTISNNGKKAGQSVDHMHWHFVAGKDLKTIAQSLE